MKRHYNVGKDNSMYGKTHSEEVRKKISSSRKAGFENGSIISWNKGKKTGVIPWNKGKKTDQIPWNKGKKNVFSLDARKRISESRRGKPQRNAGRRPTPGVTVDIIKVCECGCNETIHYIGRHDRVPRFKKGHNIRGVRSGVNNPFYGKKWTSYMRERLSGENHYNWTGDYPKYDALHAWLKRNWPGPIPTSCGICGLNKKLDLANIRPDINDETYNRDFKNWRWICRRCHEISDERARRNLKRPWEKRK